MNKKTILSSLNNIANDLDIIGKTEEADEITNIMHRISFNVDENDMASEESEDPLFLAIKKEIDESDLGISETESENLAEEIYNNVIRRIEESRIQKPENTDKFTNMAKDIMDKMKGPELGGKMRSPIFPYENLPDYPIEESPKY